MHQREDPLGLRDVAQPLRAEVAQERARRERCPPSSSTVLPASSVSPPLASAWSRAARKSGAAVVAIDAHLDLAARRAEIRTRIRPITPQSCSVIAAWRSSAAATASTAHRGSRRRRRRRCARRASRHGGLRPAPRARGSATGAAPASAPWRSMSRVLPSTSAKRKRQMSSLGGRQVHPPRIPVSPDVAPDRRNDVPGVVQGRTDRTVAVVRRVAAA